MNATAPKTDNNSIQDELREVGLYNDAFVRLGTLGIRNVADLGCGTGPFVRIMTQRGQKPNVYWGVDNDMEKIEIARKRYPEWNFNYGDLFSERIRNEFVKHEGFLLIKVLEYLENDQELIASLPQGGQVVMAAPQKEAPDRLRWYASSEDVKSRYSHFLEIKFKGRYIGHGNEVWWMVIGQRRY